MTNRYRWYERLRELSEEAESDAAYELAHALLDLARLVLNEQERAAMDLLDAVPSRG